YFHKGIIHKVTRNIPLDKINTIDLSQNLLNQLFHLSRVKIDTESISDIGSEIILLLKTDRAKTLQEALLKKSVSQEGSIEKGNTYSVSPMELIRYSLLSNGLMETIFVLFALHEHISSIANLIGLNSDTYFDNILVTINRLLAFVGISLVMGFLIVLLRNIIRYTGFKVQIEPDTLQISYGLFEKKKFSLKRQKIKGIHIKQSLLMQWFHKYSIEVESIGYGDEGDEKAVLYPYCNEELKKQIINELLPEIHHKNESIHGPPKKSLIHFIFFKVLAASIAAFMIAFIIGLIWLGIPLIIAAGAYGYMAYKNAAMGIENGLVYMSRGGFTKKQSYIYGHYIQSIGQSYNCFQKKRGICSYSVIIWGGLFKNIKVKHMENTLLESYVNYIN
ncbi:MAG: PH domain-containing protein, partial [Clostridia bacterium]|nr:PH domain-containing protein [Clostridia bacterium]